MDLRVDHQRRRFLVGLGAAAAVPVLGGLTGCLPGGRRVLSAADVVYRGSFRLPGTVAGSDASWGATLAFRRVAGERRLLAATVNGQQFFEVRVPSAGGAEPYPEAPLVRTWGDVTGGQRPLDGSGPRGSEVYGIYWDEPTRRLLWSYGDGYNTVSGRDPSLGASTLDDVSGRATPVGAWRFAGRSCKMTMGGISAVPRWFSDAHCPGQRLAAGFGGYFSIVAVGPASMGPALAAFDPGTMGSTAPGGPGSVAARPLVGYQIAG